MKMNYTAKEFQDRLLSWYDANKRILPWRNQKDPYRIWVSEIMLQQTRVTTVIPYYERFISQIPDVKHLATVDDEILYKFWQGLGYYRRAQNMKKAAEVIQQQLSGVLPRSFAEWILLPGIGPYIAGAIASIAYGEKITAVDGNVIRVFSRLYGIDIPMDDRRLKPTVEGLVNSLLPDQTIGDFNQALMEIGATICLPNAFPKCECCPFTDICLALTENKVADYPISGMKKTRSVEKKTVLLIKHGDLIALRKRPDGGLLGNLWEFPNVEGHLDKHEIEAVALSFAITPISIIRKDDKKHIFTHKEWQMQSYQIEAKSIDKQSPFTWVRKSNLHDAYPLPKAFAIFLESDESKSK